MFASAQKMRFICHYGTHNGKHACSFKRYQAGRFYWSDPNMNFFGYTVEWLNIKTYASHYFYYPESCNQVAHLIHVTEVKTAILFAYAC